MVRRGSSHGPTQHQYENRSRTFLPRRLLVAAATTAAPWWAAGSAATAAAAADRWTAAPTAGWVTQSPAATSASTQIAPAWAAVTAGPASTSVADAAISTKAPFGRALAPRLPHHQLCGLHGKGPVDVPLLILITPDRGISALAVHALNRADNAFSRRYAEQAWRVLPTSAAATSAPALGLARRSSSGGTDCLPGADEAEVLAGDRILVFFSKVLARVEGLDTRRQHVAVLSRVQDQRPSILVATEDEFFFLLADGLLPPGGQQGAHADRHHGHHHQQHDHREPVSVQSRARSLRPRSGVQTTLTN